MGAYRKPVLRSDEEKVRELTTVTDPSILRYKAKLHREFGKYETSLENLRRQMDAALGDRKLTDVLYEMRHERA